MNDFKVRMVAVCNASGGHLHKSFVTVMDLLLSESTKEIFVKTGLSDQELAEIICRSIQEIEHGTMDTIDHLVKNKMLEQETYSVLIKR